MGKIVYAVFDNELGQLHQFAVDATILAKDAVNAFMSEKIMYGWEDDATMVEHKKDILTAISESKSPADLIQTLIGFGFILNMLAV